MYTLKRTSLLIGRLYSVPASKSTADNLAHAKVAAQDIAASRNATEAGAKVLTLWKSAERAPLVIALARFLVRASPVQAPPKAAWSTMHACWLRAVHPCLVVVQAVAYTLAHESGDEPIRAMCSLSGELAVVVRADLHVLREPGGGGLPALGALPDA